MKNTFTFILFFALVSISYSQTILWEDDFSSSNYIDNYDTNYPQNFTHIPDGGQDGTGCVEMKVVKDTHYGGSLRWMMKENLGYEPTEVYAEYSVRYDESCGPLIANYGGKGPGFSGTYDKAGWGNRPGYGVNGWSARGMVSAKTGYLSNGFYVYHTYTNYDAPYVEGTTDYRNERPVEYEVSNPGSQPHADTDTWGSGMGWGDDGNFQYNTWYNVKQYVKMNDIGKNNGILKAWVNGNLVLNIDDICFRTVDELKIYCYWFNYYNGGSAVAKDNCTIQIDNFKLYNYPPVDVTGIEVTPEIASVEANSYYQLTAKVLPEGASVKTAIWISRDESIAVVSSGGEVRGVAEGETYIVATSVDGDFMDSCSVTITPVPIDPSGNVAYKKYATASGSDSNKPAGAVDGSTSTRWSSRYFPQWIMIDLGKVYSINKTEVVGYLDRAYKYTIESKVEIENNYTEIVSRTDNTTPGTASSPTTDSFTAINARYVKMNIVGCASTTEWASICELRVFGKEVATSSHQLNKTNAKIYPNPFQSTLSINLENSNYTCANIININGQTVWSKDLNGQQSITIDTGYDVIPKGVYILQLNSNTSSVSSKIIRK